MARGELVKRKRVLAGQNFLLPRLDLFLAPRRHRLHDAIDERADMLVNLRDAIHRDGNRVGSIQSRGCCGAVTILPQGQNVLVLVLLALLDDRKLRNFRWGFGVNIGLHFLLSVPSIFAKEREGVGLIVHARVSVWGADAA